MFFLRHIRLTLTCISIVANALSAGGIFTFPLMSPALAEHLKLSQPQLTTIALFGIIGQYPFAALVGKAIDHYGPWSCSLVSSLLFSTGFGLFAQEISRTPDNAAVPSKSAFERLAVYFFLAGLGTVTSYFSSLFAASKNFPEYIGIASGTSMALFGLSPLFLSMIASGYFSSDETGLDVTKYMTFMAFLAGIVHLIGAFNLKTPSVSAKVSDDMQPSPPSHSDVESNVHQSASERTPLLPAETSHDSSSENRTSIGVRNQNVVQLLRDPYFWLLGLTVLVCLGSCEMVIGNIGTIVLSLPSSAAVPSLIDKPPPASTVTANQVRLLSLANTLSRLITGPVADFVSPVASYLPCGSIYFARKHHISRLVFIAASGGLLSLTFSWMVLGVQSQEDLWLLSVGTGVAYGSVFTALPGIVSSIWGLQNLGRNFGIITYAPFLGTPLFSYLYAFVSAANADGSRSVCLGKCCWTLTFSLAIAASIVSLFTSVVLWKKWHGRV